MGDVCPATVFSSPSPHSTQHHENNMKTRSELDAMTVKQLRRYVIDRGLSFPYLGESKKAEIINKLIQFRAAREDETSAPPKAELPGPKHHALATPTPAPTHPLSNPAARGVHIPLSNPAAPGVHIPLSNPAAPGVHIPLSNPAAPGVHIPHTTGDVDDLFSLYRRIVHDTAMSVDARAGYLTAVVRVDKRISRRLDSQPNETLVALFRERLAAEDSQRVTVHPLAAQSFEEAAKEMSGADLGASSDE
ncbi:hypothetical protein [Myxococcus xanthus]|nr:hypothetical protein [Myxococcus xanthus]UYI24002.1 hypothetical protein N1129_10065 [Myxococcus xanthus]